MKLPAQRHAQVRATSVLFQGRPPPSRRRNSIVLTSLVDVLFVLLMFFLLASKSLQPEPLPLALDAAAISAPVTLQLLPQGQYTLDGEPRTLAQALTQLGAGAAVQVRAGEAIPLRSLMDTLEALRRAHITPVLSAGA